MKQEREMITVVNLCYNTGLLVLKTLDSIMNQSFKNIELIIIDDASSDNSVELIDRWLANNSCAAKFIKHSKNQGIVNSLNEAFTISKGNYFTLICDDIWDIDFLKKSFEILSNTDEKVGMVYSSAEWYDINTDEVINIIGTKRSIETTAYPRKADLLMNYKDGNTYYLKKEFIQDYLFWSNPVPAFTILIKKEALKKIKGYDTSYSFEDLNCWYLLSEHYDFILNDEVLGRYIKHEKNFSTLKKVGLFYDVIRIMHKYRSRICYHDTKHKYRQNILTNFNIIAQAIKVNKNKRDIKKYLHIVLLIISGFDMKLILGVFKISVSVFLYRREL